jgi:nucleotide-binding universal stress UspA family protein
MIQRILVPTDGSELSERAVPLALALARAQAAELIFTRVVQPPSWNEIGAEGYLAGDTYAEVVAALNEEAKSAVETLGERARHEGLPVRTAVLDGFPAAQLLDYEAEAHPDLVVMASHGRSGLARFALGSVADRLVREGSAPVLVVRSFSPAGEALARALVLLDGSALAEQVLPLVESLAGRPLRSIRLLRVVQSQTEFDEASIYLAGIASRLTQAGLLVDPEVSLDSPLPAIARAVESADLVIMATHGRGGLDRLRHGSVAEGVVRQVPVPVLLVRAAVPARQSEGATSELLDVF